MKEKFFMHHFDDNLFDKADKMIQGDDNLFVKTDKLIQGCCALVVDSIDDQIVKTLKKEALELGYTDFCLMDRGWVLSIFAESAEKAKLEIEKMHKEVNFNLNLFNTASLVRSYGEICKERDDAKAAGDEITELQLRRHAEWMREYLVKNRGWKEEGSEEE